MFQFVLGNVGFGGWVETSEDGGGNCIAGFDPEEEGCRGFAEVSANFQQGTERTKNLGVGFNTGEGMGDEFGERMRCGGGYFLDISEIREEDGLIGQEEGG